MTTGPRHAPRVPPAIWWISLIMALLGLLSTKPFLIAFGALLIPVFFSLLWRLGEPPVLLFAVGFQWMQVITPVLRATLVGPDVVSRVAAPSLDRATFLGLMALLVLAVGMWLGRGRRGLSLRSRALSEGVPFSVWKLGFAWVLAHIVSGIVGWIGWRAGGLSQALAVLDMLVWVAVFLVIWSAMIDRRFLPLAVVVVVAEFLVGFMGYFSSFKNVLFVLLTVSLTVQPTARRWLRPSTVLVFAVGFLTLAFWQSVKFDYRDFLNQGTESQAVLVPVEDRVMFLLDRVVNLDAETLRDGFEAGVERAGYLQYFGAVLETVPSKIEYQSGRLWGEAVRHVFTPRLFFPDKPAIDDSKRVSEFTGMRVAGAAQGTSISLGYLAESYIDFGPVFMYLPVFAMGLFWGWSYRTLATTGPHRLLSLALASSFILSGALLFESSNMKIVGGAITGLIVSWLLLKFGSNVIWSVMSHRRYRVSRATG
jgi:hypothetical protein